MAKGGLRLHGGKWYLKLSIPPSVRKFFLSNTGKPLDKIVEPLAGDKAIAKVMAAQRVAECTSVFAQCKAGIITTPQQAKDALQGGYSEPDIALQPGFDAAMRQYLAQQPALTRGRDKLLAQLGVPPEVRPKLDEAIRRLLAEHPIAPPTDEQIATRFEQYGDGTLGTEQPATARPASTGSETISQAAAAWYAELMRDESTAPRQTTLDGHKRRAQAFINAVGDLPLTDVTGIMASDFLAGLKVSNRTRNNYRDTLNYIFKYAAKRGRFSKVEEDNPFHDQRSKVGKSSYVPFTIPELQTLFKALPREIKPAKHSPDTALPWVALIALYTGARLEEIAQLTTSDVREENANGATVTIIDVHNGGSNNLKNEISERFIPVHSALVRAGMLDYVKALKPGPLFPGLIRRESKGGKVGARLGELFRKKLVALGIKRAGLCFHSLRHNVATALRQASPRVPKEDAAPVLGHAIEGESYGTYAQAGPGLINVKATVEQIIYPGLEVA
jgi:integrase